MGLADHTRAQAFTDTKTAMADALGAGWTYQDRIDVRTAPQGKAQKHYSVGPADTAIDAGRGKSTDRAKHSDRLVVMLAVRTTPKRRDAGRATFLAGIDALQRAAHSPTSDALGLELWVTRTAEHQSPSGEWWYAEVFVSRRYTFALDA